MLKFLLVFVTITVAWCHDNCPAYPAYDGLSSDGSLQQLLCGTFSLAYTSATPSSCLKVAFETDANNNIIGHFQSPGCCLNGYYKVNSTSTEMTYDIGPVPCYAAKCPLLSKQKGSMKLLGKIGSGKSLCLIIAECQPDYYGTTVMCRDTPPPFRCIKKLLHDLIGDSERIDEANFQSICQDNCVFPENNCS